MPGRGRPSKAQRAAEEREALQGQRDPFMRAIQTSQASNAGTSAEDLEQYEPIHEPPKTIAGEVPSPEKGGCQTPADRFHPKWYPAETPSNRGNDPPVVDCRYKSTNDGRFRGKSALSRTLWEALDDPSLPKIPFIEGDKRWPGTTEAQEAWMRAVVDDLPHDHPGGWFYPPDGSLEVTPNLRKYQLWPFFFWRLQNSVWAKLRCPEDPSNALPCIKNPNHNILSNWARRTRAEKKWSLAQESFTSWGERFRCTTCLGGSMTRESLRILTLEHTGKDKQKGLAQELGALSGRILRADHTRPLAGKVDPSAGVKWSYSVMNEVGEVLTHAFTETDGDAQALFKVNEEDMRLLIEAIMVAFGFADPSEAANKLKKNPGLLYRFVRRQIPEKQELEARIMSVVDSARNVVWEGEMLLPPGPDGFERCLKNQMHHRQASSTSKGKRGPLDVIQASYLSGSNVGDIATQALVIDGITRHNRKTRRKVDGVKNVYPLLDNDILQRLRHTSNTEGGLYPHLVLNAAETGESFALEYTAALRKELLEAELHEARKGSPAETVAASEDIHGFEMDATELSIDRVIEILDVEHDNNDVVRRERHLQRTGNSSTARRISKLRMFGRNTNFLDKVPPERYTLQMRVKIDGLIEQYGEQNADEVHKQYYMWFLEQKNETPATPLLDTSRLHIEQYITKRKAELASAVARVPDRVTAARRTHMENVLSSGTKPITPAEPSQATAPRLPPKPLVPPPPPTSVPDKKQMPGETVSSGPKILGQNADYVNSREKAHGTVRFTMDHSTSGEKSGQMQRFLEIKATKSAGQRNRGRAAGCIKAASSNVEGNDELDVTAETQDDQKELDSEARCTTVKPTATDGQLMIRKRLHCTLCKQERSAATGAQKAKDSGSLRRLVLVRLRTVTHNEWVRSQAQ
ncbi:hypothetical protein FOZ60_007132 [Perkinsus olseni]|uniref:Uncharacterized protein n=1 Tax=Perkinsus olseni TaxID=32597 RepID=A0A7J6NLY6_PEROL|nr:hypothetical protein FOZ60_007132 [Perkinsus olseni]